jgi:diacylglycerol kinase
MVHEESSRKVCGILDSMKQLLSQQHRRFRDAFRGFRKAYRNDFNFKLQVWSGVFFVVFGYLTSPLTESEFLFLALAYALILITELLNTSFEIALDKIHPERHDHISASKDIAAAAVLTAGFFALIVVGAILAVRM